MDEVKAVIEKIHPIVAGLQAVQKLSAGLTLPIQIILGLLGLSVALWSAAKWSMSALDVQHAMNGALPVNLETTDSAYKGVVAYLLADLADELPAATSNKVTPLSIELSDALGRPLGGKKPEGKPPESKAERPASMPQEQSLGVALQLARTLGNPDPNVDPNGLLGSLHLEVSGDPPTYEQVIIGSYGSDAFIRVPAVSLNGFSLRHGDKLFPEGALTLRSLLERNESLLLDLSIAIYLAPRFAQYDEQRLKDEQPLANLVVMQSYFITQDGMIVIRKAHAKNQFGYYHEQFPSYFSFTQRPYFWKAISQDRSGNSYKAYRTEPYIDMGGNGVVVTYAQRVDLPGGRLGVFCLDAQVPEYESKLKSRVSILGDQVESFEWTIGVDNTKIVPNGFEWFDKDISEAKSQVALLGAIARQTPDQSLSNTETDTFVRFTVPLDSREKDANGLKRATRVLPVQVNFSRIHRQKILSIVGVALGASLFFVSIFNILQDYLLLRHRMALTLANISRVMAKASTPFARFNERNEFEDANASFLEISGYDNIEDLKETRGGGRRTFRSMLTPESQASYDKVLDASSRGDDTDEYDVILIRKDGTRIKVTAHGERIPFPKGWRRELPHRFGVLLKWGAA